MCDVYIYTDRSARALNESVQSRRTAAKDEQVRA